MSSNSCKTTFSAVNNRPNFLRPWLVRFRIITGEPYSRVSQSWLATAATSPFAQRTAPAPSASIGASIQTRPRQSNSRLVSATMSRVYSAVCGPSFFARAISPVSTAASHFSTASTLRSFLPARVSIFRSCGRPSKMNTGSIPFSSIQVARSRNPIK